MTDGAYLDLLKFAVPETIVLVTALAVLTADLLGMRELTVRVRTTVGALISCAGCAVGIGWILLFPEHANYQEGMFIIDPTTRALKVALLLLSGFTALLSVRADFTRHVGEYLALVLLATIGMMFLVSAGDILMIFISLELTSLSLYVLAGFNKRSPLSAEAALKYYLFGGMAAAFTLFGLSLLYGISGATSLSAIGAAIRGPKLDPLLLLALVMTAAGLGFKVAAAPFHLWAPDVYQGAPAPSAAFIASASKVAGFFVLARVMSDGFAGAEGSAGWQAFAPGWIPLLVVMAALSMVLGNLVALGQTSVRRLLAYSAIAHAGYMLLGIISQPAGLASICYYVVTYAFATLGAFGVISVVEAESGGDRLSDFAGLSRRAPILSGCMMVFLLSLAGIPPLAGFFGKFYIFANALHGRGAALELLWLVVLAMGMSAVSLYYYLVVLKQIFVRSSDRGGAKLEVDLFVETGIVALALAVLLLGCFPSWLLERF